MSATHSISRPCRVCGITFLAPAKEVKRGGGTCCSSSCGAKLPRRPLAERFLDKVQKTDSCWIWIGGLSSYGYGMIWTGKRQDQAHRVSWQLFRGHIPDGLCVLHNCPGGDNTRCVNPDHLFIGTKKENNTDRAKKGRNRDQRGEKNEIAILSEEQVLQIRSQYSAGVTQRKLATEYGVCFQNISDIVRRKTWKHI